MDYSAYIDIVGKFIDILGVVGIVAGVLVSLAHFVMVYFSHDFGAAYEKLRRNLGRTVLLGLELLIAGDIIRSIAVPPSLNSVAVLAVIVLIRSFLSMQIEKEIKWSLPSWKHHKE